MGWALGRRLLVNHYNLLKALRTDFSSIPEGGLQNMYVSYFISFKSLKNALGHKKSAKKKEIAKRAQFL